jgi:hypothetical protein
MFTSEIETSKWLVQCCELTYTEVSEEIFSFGLCGGAFALGFAKKDLPLRILTSVASCTSHVARMAHDDGVQ